MDLGGRAGFAPFEQRPSRRPALPTTTHQIHFFDPLCKNPGSAPAFRFTGPRDAQESGPRDAKDQGVHNFQGFIGPRVSHSPTKFQNTYVH